MESRQYNKTLDACQHGRTTHSLSSILDSPRDILSAFPFHKYLSRTLHIVDEDLLGTELMLYIRNRKCHYVMRFLAKK